MPANAVQLDEAQVERLIRISKAKPLLPEEFVPWQLDPADEELFMPEHLVSLQGHPLWDTLTPHQQRELGRHEIVQVMYSYGWSEGLACLFFNRHLLTLSPQSVEYRFLLRELIEEFRHQEMFSTAVSKLEGDPVRPSFWHHIFGKFTSKYAPADVMFISVLAVELMTDIYGKYIRRDERVFPVLRKVSELHNIEEGRHIFYTKLWLQQFTQNASFARRTLYSVVVLLNLYFMRTLYVRVEIFRRIGVSNPVDYARAASKNLKVKMADRCLEEAIEFTQSFNGFNAVTRPLWRWVMGTK